MLYFLYYIICVAYCFARSYKTWIAQDLGANSMELMMVIAIGWVLAPIDFGIIWFKRYYQR